VSTRREHDIDEGVEECIGELRCVASVALTMTADSGEVVQ